MAEKFLRLAAVMAATGLGRSTLYRLIAQGDFPRPVKILGPRCCAWPESEIVEWQRLRIAERDAADDRAA
ncbi:MAG: AlpA family transcriptional regulator [Pseudorhodoplanes sp.]|nr:AlpA family transcriptional regulator [Pseudorhodoplanes sp.]